MTRENYGCLCCNPMLAELFRMNHHATELAEQWAASDHATHCFHSGTNLSRRDFVRGGAALAGAALASAAGLTPVEAQAQDTETRVFTGGTILTVDKDFSEAQAIAVHGNKILAVGNEADVRKAAGNGAEVVDLNGRVMLPGFVDPHTHMMSGSAIASLGDYVGVAKFAKTDDVLKHLTATAAKATAGAWIFARNFDPTLQDGPDALTFKEFDAVSTDHPVFVLNASGHLAYANRKAFEAAGIDESVKNPPGAEFVRGPDGKLNGTLKNNVAYLQVLQANPALSQLDPVKSLVAMTGDFAKLGLTTLSDLGMGGLTNGAGDWALYQKAGADGALKARLRVYPFYTYDEAWDKAGVRAGDGNAMVRIAGYKIVADGSNQGFTGLQREAYQNTHNTGLAYTTTDEMKRLILKRGRQGWPLAIHGNGDKGIDNILAAYQAAREEGLDLTRLRPRIEHCSILHDDQIARMKALGVSASFLIGHVHFWGVAMRDKIFGEAKAKLLDRARSCEKAGVRYTVHSDFFVTDPDPLHMIEMAVTRRTWKEPDYVLAPDETVSVESAIRAVTSEAAWQLSSEHEVGSLEVGKFADMVILDKDPRKVAPETIKNIKVLETFTDGTQVFEA